MALVISLSRRRHEFDDSPLVANVQALGQIHAIFQTHLQGSVGGSPEALMNLLRFQVSPHIAPLEESGLLSATVTAPLRRFVHGEELAPGDIQDIARRVRAAHDFLLHADSPAFQGSEYVGPSGTGLAFRRMTDQGRLSLMPPPTLRQGATVTTAQPAKISYGQYIHAAIIETDFASYEEKAKRVRRAEEVTARLNRYFFAMQDVMKAYGVIQDNFIGDATLSYVYQYTNNSERAVRMALDMQKGVARINDELRAEAMRRPEFHEKFRQMGRTFEDLKPEELEALIDEIDPIIFQMRVGVNKGEINLAQLGNPDFFSKLTIIGSPVNTAARLEAAAPLGGVFVSDAILSDLPTGLVEAKHAGEIKVKKNTFNAHLVIAVRAQAIGGRKGKVQLAVQGRDTEIAEIEGWMRSAVEEQKPQFVLLQAAAGEGKSTIADAFLQRVQNLQPLVLYGQGDLGRELDQHYVILEMLRREASFNSDDAEDLQTLRIRGLAARADSDAQGDSEQRNQRELDAHLLSLFLRSKPLANPPAEIEFLLKNPNDFRRETEQMLIRLFSGLGRGRPLLILMDDMQWADLGSRSLLHRLLTQLTDKRLMVLGLRRNEPFPADEPDWFAGPFTTTLLELEPLSENSLAEIVAEVLGAGADPATVRTILDRSGGNPLFAQEIAVAFRGGMAVGQMPGTVQELFQAQLQRLDENQLYLLKVASIVGRDFSERDLREMGISEPGLFLTNLAEADFIIAKTNEKGVYQFRHDLLRQAVLATMEEGEKQQLHVACANYLAHLGSSDMAVIASHYEEGGNSVQASQYYYKAAEETFYKGELQAAASLYEKAYNFGQDSTSRLKILRGWDEALFMSAEYEKNDHIYSLASELLKSLPDVSLGDQAGVHYRVGRSLTRRRKFEEAERELTKALQIAGDRTDTNKLKGVVLMELGLNYVNRGEVPKAKVIYDQAIKLAREVGDKLLIGRILIGINYVEARLGNYSLKLQVTREASQIFEEIGDTRRAGTAFAALGNVLMLLGAYDEAEKNLKMAETIAKRYGRKAQNLESLYGTFGRAVHLHGRKQEAIRRLEPIVGEDADPLYVTYSLVYLALAYADNNQLEEAKVSAERAVSMAVSQKEKDSEAMARMALAVVHFKLGRPLDALQESERSVQIFVDLEREEVSIAEFDLQILLTHAEILAHLNRHQDAWRSIDKAKNLLETRASVIGEDAYRKSFLTKVDVNREIGRFWQILKATTSRDLDVYTKSHLGQQNFYPPDILPEEVRFVNLQMVNEISINNENEHYASAGVLIDAPLASVFSTLVSSEVWVDRNPTANDIDPGLIEGVWAEDIHWKTFYGDEGTLYAILNWKTGSALSLHKLIFPFVGQHSNRRELLKDQIYSRDGAVHIELKKAPENKVKSSTGAVIEVDPEIRPRKFQFGDIRFILVPTNDDKTILVMEMGRALYTQNPWNILRALVDQIQ